MSIGNRNKNVIQSKVKQLFLTLLLILNVISINVHFALAHESKTDGSITGLLHIVPNDDPYIQEPSYMIVDFTDTTKTFSADTCDCTVSISEQGRELYRASSSDQSFTKTPHSISFAFTFPEFNIYTLTIEGKPGGNETYQPFKLTYDIRVDEIRSSGDHSSLHALFGDHWHHLAPAVIVAIAAVIIFIQDRLKQRRYNKKRL
jgi:hypothetical protein